MMFQVALLLLQAVAVLGATDPFGIQMGPAAGQGTFASSFLKDPTSGRLFVTGSSYDMGKNMAYRCFFATIESGNVAMQHTYGHSAVDENDPMSTSQACSHLMVHENRVFLAGHSGSDTTGNLEALYNRGAVIRNYRYGFVMDLMQSAEAGSKFDLLGGLILQQAAAVYPISTTSSPSDDTIYIASMKSDQSTGNGQGLPAMDPNLVLPVGKTYGLILESYGIIQDVVPSGAITKTFTQKHRAFYQPGNGGSVYIASMLKINDDTLIVAGHTYGQGRGFGKSASSQNILEASDSLDGFVTKFAASSLVPSITDDNGINSTFRIESTDSSSEYIYGMCGHGYGENADGNHVYVVGATTGSLASTGKGKAVQDAFIMKLQVGTTEKMEMVWVRQLSVNDQDASAEARLFGISCAVSPSDGHVWWAGHVTNGARVRSSTARAFGGQDIFVEKLVAEDGDVVFTKQFGSSHDDEIAWRGGLQVDDEGNALLVGNTLGPLFRQKTDFDKSDVFAMSISPNGKIYLPLDDGAEINGGHILPPISDADIEEDDSSSQNTRVALIILLAVLVGATFFVMLYVRGRRKYYEATTDRAKVIGYLKGFDVEDVEIKHSATGGWHCSYANGLARGKVKLPYSDAIRNSDSESFRSGADQLTRPLNSPDESSTYTGSGATRKSLFMDEYDSLFAVGSSSSSRFGNMSSRVRAEEDERGFGSLVDDYSASYSDRRSERSKNSGRWGQQIV